VERYAREGTCAVAVMIMWDVFWGGFFTGGARESVAVLIKEWAMD